MSIILSFVNEKGGSAKTTSACSVAALLAEALSDAETDIKPVLLVDADPAGGSTMELAPKEPPELYYSELISNYCKSGEIGDIRKAIVPTGFPNLDIMPADSFLGIATNEMSLLDIAREKTLSFIFEELHKYYSWIIIDTIGAKHNILTINVLSLLIPASRTFVAIPCEPEAKNIKSFYNTKALINTINKANINKVHIIAVFFTQVDERRGYDQAILSQGEELFGEAYCNTPIHYAGAVTKLATQKHMPINHIKPRSRIAQDYEALCNEIINRILGGKFNE